MNNLFKIIAVLALLLGIINFAALNSMAKKEQERIAYQTESRPPINSYWTSEAAKNNFIQSRVAA